MNREINIRVRLDVDNLVSGWDTELIRTFFMVINEITLGHAYAVLYSSEGHRIGNFDIGPITQASA